MRMYPCLAVLALLVAALGLQACYGSADGDPQTTTDSSTDVAPDPGTDWIGDGAFRATPEKPFPTTHVEAAMPSLASTDDAVALVYRASSGGGGPAQIVFQFLDPYGGTIGSPEVVTSGYGFADAIPNVSAADDGSFLVCALDTSIQGLNVARFTADGTMTAATGTIVEAGVMSPISGPILVDGSVFVVAGYSAGAPGEVALFRFAYPSLELDAWARMISFNGFGINPVLLRSYYDPAELIVNSSSTGTSPGAPWGASAIEDVYPDSIRFTGAITTFGGDSRGNPVMAHHAAMGEITWYGFSILPSDTESSWHVSMFDEIGDNEYHDALWVGPWMPGSPVHWRMDSAMTELPTGGAAFSVTDSGRWKVWVFVIDGGGPPAPRETFVVGDADPSYAPNTAITWTDGGFLVMWDEECAGGAICLSSSFVEVD